MSVLNAFCCLNRGMCDMFFLPGLNRIITASVRNDHLTLFIGHLLPFSGHIPINPVQIDI